MDSIYIEDGENTSKLDINKGRDAEIQHRHFTCAGGRSRSHKYQKRPVFSIGCTAYACSSARTCPPRSRTRPPKKKRRCCAAAYLRATNSRNNMSRSERTTRRLSEPPTPLPLSALASDKPLAHMISQSERNPVPGFQLPSVTSRVYSTSFYSNYYLIFCSPTANSFY